MMCRSLVSAILLSLQLVSDLFPIGVSQTALIVYIRYHPSNTILNDMFFYTDRYFAALNCVYQLLSSHMYSQYTFCFTLDSDFVHGS